ncbi:MAG: hypothetical protein H6648_07180 [Caldilineae bacterium]|nr:hypothetical protein [Caldilineae bacterium]
MSQASGRRPEPSEHPFAVGARWVGPGSVGAHAVGPRLRTRAWRAAALTGLAALALFAVPAGAQSAFPDRDGLLANGTDTVLSEARIQEEFSSRLGDPYHLDGLALMVDDCRPDPEVYLDEALVHYGLSAEAGKMYDDAVVWLICFQPRYVGFFYGADNPYAPEWDAAGVSDRAAGAMAEQLAAGNFTGGLTVGIDAVADLLEGNAPASSALDEAPAPAGAPLPSQARPNDGDSGSGGMAAQLAAAGALGLGGLWLWRRRKREAEGAAARAAAPTPAPATRSAHGALEAKLGKLEARLKQDQPAIARLVLAYQSIGEEAMLEVSRQHDAMLARLAALRTRVAELPEIGRPDEAAGAAVDSGLQQRYAEADAEADALLAYADRIDAEADHVEMLEERAAVLTVEARKAIDRAAVDYAALLSKLDPDVAPLPAADAALDLPTRLAEQAEQVLATGDRITAGRLAEDAATLAAQTPKALEELLAVDLRIEAGVKLFERVSAYAESSWADIRGNGSEAEESLDAALEMLRRILAAKPEAFGADLAAGYMASLEQLAAELDRARGLVAAIEERLQRLDQARAGAVDQVDALRADIAKARQWLTQPEVAPDVDAAPELALTQAEAMLDGLSRDMAEAKPDWLAITRGIHAVAGKVEASLADARRQNDHVDALRSHWVSAREAAAAAIQRAEQYLALHRAEAPAAAGADLEAARAQLRLAEQAARDAEGMQDSARAEALTRALSAAEAADGAASTVYEALAAAVAKADQARSYVPRPDWIGPTVPLPMPRRRGLFIPGPFDVGMGPTIRLPRPAAPPRSSSWGSRPRPSTRPVSPRSIQRSGGSRPSSGRRGGGKGW